MIIPPDKWWFAKIVAPDYVAIGDDSAYLYQQTVGLVRPGTKSFVGRITPINVFFTGIPISIFAHTRSGKEKMLRIHHQDPEQPGTPFSPAVAMYRRRAVKFRCRNLLCESF